ncbi:MAG: triose-phosphate isomerase [Anaerolineaceae bacterium]|nr:triose-phosphate isomerase [Anaerolineaceae bacterium]MDD4043523.1 triose-phosphate isomerase [Anaerolineaceae bacterium]MDD4577325.1 triose-phosphate isomerase [Anaerolineaceae bacterium]
MKTRKPMVAGNWKMNKTVSEAAELLEALKPELKDIDNVDLVVCTPFIDLPLAKEALLGSNIKVGAQNLHWEASGAYTGEISAPMLKDLCEFVIIGHSERRAMFGETDETVNKKVVAALGAGLLPIVCVGETLEENEAAQTEAVVSRMVREGLKGLTNEEATRIVVAYEPVWAIGTGKTATPDQANNVHKNVVRPILREMFGDEVGNGMRILYGGSVKPSNAAELFGQSDIDGGLIGGASLKADDFKSIVQGAL